MKKKIAIILIFIFARCLSIPENATAQQSSNNTVQPWTYWWWMGSSVTKTGITENLEDMHIAGIGGVHIIPIYGEKGDEANYVNYLSPEWMQLLKHTIREAKRLRMGVDMTTGTGWPFGGPNVPASDAAKAFYVKAVKTEDHANIHDYQKANDQSSLVALAAYDEKGHFSEITSLVDSAGDIHWAPNLKPLKIYAAFAGLTQQKVKRAAPGGEGLVLDYFSESSISNYMKVFEDAFKTSGIEKGDIRSFYNDSYEVYGANWTSDFLSEFRKHRGYDLLPYLNLLADTSDLEIRPRVVADYCETIYDLLYSGFTSNWVKKSHEMGMLTRNQAHGSPGNLLDLYALADIPETESFGASGFSIPGLRQDPDYEEDRFGRPNPLTMKFASSAAHVSGRNLVSSESTTWLGDHFKVALSQIKPQIDELFVSGINHIFFHGTTYSPKEKPFPGRLFYASTNYGLTSHFWNELPALTEYISNCQTVLQNSEADNDILLYFPVHEVWRKQKNELFIRLFDVHKSKDWLQNSSFGNLAQRLWDTGYTFDYISDRMLDRLTVEGGNLISGNARYKVIVVPSIQHIPIETLSKLKDLATKGATIIFENDIPTDVPGLSEFEKKRVAATTIKAELLLQTDHVKISSNVLETLADQKIHAEKMATKGLEFIRKHSGDSTFYFITNLSDKFSEDWVDLATKAKTIEIYDPTHNKRGVGAIRKSKNGTAVYLQLLPGQSCILTCTKEKTDSGKWEYLEPDKQGKIGIKGNWLLTPTQGAPEIPEPITVKNLGSWTELSEKYQTYSGKVVYSNTLEVPAILLSADGFLLDLGIVRETARVKINGIDLGLVWCLPNQLVVQSGVLHEKNTIEIEVTNLSFNRIVAMDRQAVPWKNFKEINFVNIRYQPYNAANDKPVDSGLMSEIYLIPLKTKNP